VEDVIMHEDRHPITQGRVLDPLTTEYTKLFSEDRKVGHVNILTLLGLPGIKPGIGPRSVPLIVYGNIGGRVYGTFKRAGNDTRLDIHPGSVSESVDPSQMSRYELEGSLGCL
jgi:hypothetical protein